MPGRLHPPADLRVEPMFCDHFTDVADRYDVGRKLGTGNFAKVIQASCRRDMPEHGLRAGSQVAIKIIKKPSNMTPAAVSMLRSELAIMRSVNHPNVVRLYEACETPQKLYLVMQLCTGGELFDRIVNMGRYSEEDARYFTFKLLNAVLYLHDKHICHRDLKPENILLTSDTDEAELCITDFGLGKIMASAPEGLTWRDVALRTRCGTPGYAAPEVISATGAAAGERRYGLECDMWAVGVIVYILLSACPPFAAADDAKLQAKICAGEAPAFPDKYWANISDGAKDFIRGLLVVDPTKRMTAIEALQHPWVVSIQMHTSDLFAEDGDAPVPDNVRDRFGEFNLRRRTTAKGLGAVQELMKQVTGIPPDEAVLAHFRCAYDQRLGHLVLTTASVAFVSYDSVNLWLLPLEELRHINTARYMASNAATDNSLILSFQDGTTLQLDGFWRREECLELVQSSVHTKHITTRAEPPPPPPPRPPPERKLDGAAVAGGSPPLATLVRAGAQAPGPCVQQDSTVASPSGWPQGELPFQAPRNGGEPGRAALPGWRLDQEQAS